MIAPYRRQLDFHGRRPRRRGFLTPAIVVALVAVMLCAALVLDRYWVGAASCEMNAAADASARAAARTLVTDDLLRTDTRLEQRRSDARRKAVSIAGMNYVAGRPMELSPNANDGDVLFGTRVFNQQAGESRFIQVEGEARTVRVSTKRMKSRNNPIARFFNGFSKKADVDLVKSCEVTADNRLVGVRPLDGLAAPMLPLAILKADAAGLRKDVWDAAIKARRGGDEYGWNSETGRITKGGDGIPEIVLNTKKERGDGAEPTVQLVDLGNGLSPAGINRQIREGLAAEDLKRWEGELRLQTGVELKSRARFDQSIASTLKATAGEPRICLLYEPRNAAAGSAAGSTGDGDGRVLATRFVAARVMSVTAGEEGSQRIVLQPCVLVTPTAVTDDSDGYSTVSLNRYIYKIHVTH